MNGHSIKVIKKTIAAAAKNGYIVLSFDKSNKLYHVRNNMQLQNMSFDELSSVAFPFTRND